MGESLPTLPNATVYHTFPFPLLPSFPNHHQQVSCFPFAHNLPILHKACTRPSRVAIFDAVQNVDDLGYIIKVVSNLKLQGMDENRQRYWYVGSEMSYSTNQDWFFHQGAFPVMWNTDHCFHHRTRTWALRKANGKITKDFTYRFWRAVLHSPLYYDYLGYIKVVSNLKLQRLDDNRESCWYVGSEVSWELKRLVFSSRGPSPLCETRTIFFIMKRELEHGERRTAK